MEMNMKNKFNFLGLVLIIFLVSCSSSEEEQIKEELTTSGSKQIGLIDDKRILDAESEPGNWLAYGRTYEEQRFSPLEQINKETIGDLGLVWSKRYGYQQGTRSYSNSR